ncbi:MAG: hypothetical protein ACUVUP_03670 [Thermaceae bacterium]
MRYGYYTEGSLELRDGTQVLSALKVPRGITLILETGLKGEVATLTPPGKVVAYVGDWEETPFLRISIFTGEGRQYSLEVSLIGEARLRRSP